MADVFLSYSRMDREQAHRFAKAIEDQGWSVWWDPSIEPGDRFHEVITRELAQAACTVVLWSESSVASRWVLGEAEESAEREILVPIRIDGCKIPTGFRALQTSDFSAWLGDTQGPEFAELKRAIYKLAGPPQSPAQQQPFDIHEQQEGPGPRRTAGRQARGWIRPGTRLGRYELTRLIAASSQGEVYEARDTTLSRVVAVKLLPQAGSLDLETRERFEQEARVLANLDHPHIVKVHDFLEVDGHLLIVQELVSGGSLKRRLDEMLGPDVVLDERHERWAVELCRGVAEGLQHAHERGVVHRDVKPSNILLTEDGTPKLVDFGLARVLGQAGISRQVALRGTLAYLSPDQIEEGHGGSKVDPRTDVYSLGIVLYLMCSGRPPFDLTSLSVGQILSEIQVREPRPPGRLQASVSPDLECVILHAIEKHRDDRYETAEEFAEDLQRILEGATPEARRVGRLVRWVRHVQRQPTVSLVLLMLLLSVAWFLTDTSWLEDLATRSIEEDAGSMAVPARFAFLGIAALVLGLLATPLASRWLLHRTRGRLAAATLATLMLLGGILHLTDQVGDARHVRARQEFIAVLDSLPPWWGRDVSIITDYIESEEDRLDVQDHALIIRELVKRHRADEAQAHLDKLAFDSSTTLIDQATLLGLRWLLGDEDAYEPCRDTLAQITAAGSSTIADLSRAGEVYEDLELNGEALDAYREADRVAKDASPRWLSRLIAQAATSLCRDAEAAPLFEYLRRSANAERSDHLRAVSIHTRLGDREAADAAWNSLEGGGGNATDEIEARFEYLRAFESEPIALAYLQGLLETHPEEVEVLQWCAYLLRIHAKRNGARETYLRSRDAYLQLAAVAPGDVTSPVGLSAVHFKLGDYEKALAYAEAAVVLNDDYFEAHYSLALTRNRILKDAKPEGGFTLEEVDSVLEPLRRAHSLNSLDTILLNNLAMWLCRRARVDQEGRDQALEEAERAIRRALRITHHSPDSRCAESAAVLVERASCLDTLRQVLQLEGRCDEALAEALRALEALPQGQAPSLQQELRAAVEDLQHAVATGADCVD